MSLNNKKKRIKIKNTYYFNSLKSNFRIHFPTAIRGGYISFLCKEHKKRKNLYMMKMFLGRYDYILS